ncbi:IclR family transcriptional regulator [Oceanobacillus salinisoli]|uniref:IclR family transcriptional regulator n=1 Tax=Oceanobacillus salinisoli TaxID=2678611 RepID=UPI0012E21E96|nr:IclR family transcriptional regulator [Oceanobacillus salinisoli]
MSQSFARGLKILDLFSSDRPVLNIDEIADKIGVSNITAYRYVHTLCDSNFLIYKNGEVRISAKILKYLHLFWEHEHLVSIAKDHITAVQGEINETIALCKLELNNIICIYRLESSLSLRSSFMVGQKMSIHAGAFARTIAAYLPEHEFKVIQNNIKWEKLTKNTITSYEQYSGRLSMIRERGYDISIEEVDPGVIGLAVPILYEGKAVASIGIGMPTVRYDPHLIDEYILKLKETAEKVTVDIRNNKELLS